MELDERKAAILRAIVEEYVATAQPVGSQTIAQSPRPRRVERHGAQRDDRARARGLHRPSRTPRPAGSPPTAATATSSTTSPAAGLAARAAAPAPSPTSSPRVDAPGARGPAPRDEPAARPGEPRTPRSSSGPHAEVGRRCAACSSSLLQPRVVLAVVDPVERRGREGASLHLDDDVDDADDRRPRARCSTRSSTGAALADAARR